MQNKPAASVVVFDPWFHVFCVPVILLSLGVLARRLGRRDGDETPRWNDAAVATSVLLMSFGAVAADLRSLPSVDSLPKLMGWLFALLCATFVSIDHDRYASWVRDEAGTPTTRKDVWFGIILPDVVALLLFGAYQWGKVF